jgi:hypothetical protein
MSESKEVVEIGVEMGMKMEMEVEGDIQFMRWISVFNLLGDECFDGFIDFSH